MFRLPGRHLHGRSDRGCAGRRRIRQPDRGYLYEARGRDLSPPKFVADAKRLIEGYSYDPENIKNVMVSELGANASWILNDSPVRLLISSKGIDTHAWYFVQDNPRNSQKTGKLPLVDCAVASASAPTYFSPWTINIDGTNTVLVDGGVGTAGNPIYQACVEAFYYDTFTPEDTALSRSGRATIPPGNTVPSGLLGWLEWTVDALLDAPEEQQTELVKRHFPALCSASTGCCHTPSTWRISTPFRAGQELEKRPQGQWTGKRFWPEVQRHRRKGRRERD